jgi:hypothetical protein
MKTGWGEGPDEQASEPQAAPGGFAGFILANRADPGQGRTLGEVLTRYAQAPGRADPEPYDDDDHQAAMVTRGYRPGLSLDLSQKLADTMGELQAEREKIERGKRRADQIRRMHEHGQISAWQIPDALGDQGDEGRVALLERRAGRLRQQLGDAQAMIAPPQARQADPLEAASRNAQQIFRELTRAKFEAAQAGRPAPRPFASRSRGGDAVRSEHCVWCTQEGLDDETAFLLHSDPERPLPVTTPELAAEQTETDRLMRLGYSAETAQYAATPSGGGMAVR